MLHFMPIEPFGHIESIVHCSEHTGVASMLTESVHTPLAHSVDVLDTTVHAEPKPALVIAASTFFGVELDEHARTNRDAISEARMRLR